LEGGKIGTSGDTNLYTLVERGRGGGANLNIVT
jgi:hypothetical protein